MNWTLLVIFPIISGLLTLLIVRLLQGIFTGESKEFLWKVLVEIMAAVVAMVVFIFNYEQGLCLRKEKLASEVVELLPKISFAANYEIGIPYTCAKAGDIKINFPDEDAAKAFEQYKIDFNLLKYKSVPLVSREHSVGDALGKYLSALRNLEEVCIKDGSGSILNFDWDKLYNKISKVNHFHGELVESLAAKNAKCYASFSDRFVN